MCGKIGDVVSQVELLRRQREHRIHLDADEAG